MAPKGVLGMSDMEDSIEEQLAALRRTFITQLPDRVSALYEAHVTWSKEGSGEILTEYHRLAHSLTGAGATFGCDAISQSARVLERFLKDVSEKGLFSVEVIEEAAKLLGSVRQDADALGGDDSPADSGDDKEGEPTRGIAPDSSSIIISKAKDSSSENPSEDERLIYLLVSQEALDAGLVAQLENFAFRVQAFSAPNFFKLAVANRRPALILADVALADGACAGIEVVAAIQAEQQVPIPTVFCADQSGDFNMRLAAARAGGVVFLPKPLKTESLIDVVDSQVGYEERRPYRVLVVNDHEGQQGHYKSVLEGARMKVQLVADPLFVLQGLAAFMPELILIDMESPTCSGLELAAVIRQQPEYVGVPIIFLSPKLDEGAELDALRIRGDDLLEKPISDAELIDAVKVRTERYRMIRSLMKRDSLTGLLNHSHIIEALEGEVARAARYETCLSFALIDVDFLKRVNDDYGHAAGDSVLRSLSRILQQRLRKADVIGRYGGEEFAVVLPETPLSAAAMVMDRVRRMFERVSYQSGEESFVVTLSCGVASLPKTASAKELHDKADQLLSEAKQAGRNRVKSNLVE